MSGIIIVWSVTIAQYFWSAPWRARCCVLSRGPRAQDRVLGFDALYVAAMLAAADHRHSHRHARSISRQRW